MKAYVVLGVVFWLLWASGCYFYYNGHLDANGNIVIPAPSR